MKTSKSKCIGETHGELKASSENPGRREAITGMLAGAAAFALGSAACKGPKTSHGAAPSPARETGPRPAASTGPFSLDELPYPMDALDPFISEKTISFHYGKHHQAYLDNTNRLVANTAYSGKDLETVVRESFGKDENVFNNAAQVYNHTFYWNSLLPGGGGEPPEALTKAVKADFGSFEKFKEKLISAAAGQFASGWAWVVFDRGNLSIESTSNADTPIAHNRTPLYTIDVWEHAYYLDYQNKRVDYIESVLDHLANWQRVNELYLAAKG